MANNENLRPPYTPSEAREFGHKGGLESGKSKRRKRFIKDTIEIILDQPIKDEKMLETMNVLGVTDVPKYKDYMVAMIITRTAESGNVMDLVRLAGLLGESPDFNADMLDEVREILNAVPSVID